MEKQIQSLKSDAEMENGARKRKLAKFQQKLADNKVLTKL